MNGSSAKIVNALFAIACLVVSTVGGLQIRDRLTPQATGRGSSNESRGAVEPVSDIALDVTEAVVRSVGTPRIGLIEFSDFQCPFSGRYARNTYPQIRRDFVDSGQVTYWFFNFPLERIHPLAFHAGESAECAARQERFWDMHDTLFRHQDVLAEGDLFGLAVGLDVRMPAFRDWLRGETVPRIRAQIEAGNRSGVTATPTFFIGPSNTLA